MKPIARLALPIVIVVLLILVVTGNFVSTSPWVIAGQILAVALAIWARRSFQAGQFSIQAEPRPGPLLSNGPYRVIRHPMYAAAMLLVVSSAVGHLSLLTALLAVVAGITIGIRILSEEQFLREHFDGYAAYASLTKRILPYVW